MKQQKPLVFILTALLAFTFLLPFAMGEETSFAYQPLYTARMVKDTLLREEKDKESPITGQTTQEEKIEILDVDIVWLFIRNKKGDVGYVTRDRIHSPEAIDPINTPPYGMEKFSYIGLVKNPLQVHHEKDLSSDSYVSLQPGAKLAILAIEEGWGKVIYWRNYAYVDMRNITDLVPVSPTDSPISSETPIAAYTSYYSVATTESNLGRMVNIDVGCERISKMIEPGEEFDLNQVMGPYSKHNGYQSAPILTGGTTVLGSGGGTCQVSSTFYNVALQLPGVEIVKRRPHGPSGAKYLPHGVDAAVGNESINLVVKNLYDFPIRVEASAQDGALYIVLWKAGY